ncbi:MAG: transcription-repair coupling factor [bacterium]|jgi:transcription-repair coupling factor (superfamily II helicase)
MLSSISERLRHSQSLSQVLYDLAGGKVPARVGGLTGSMRSMLAALLYREVGRTVVVICPAEAEKIKEDLESILGEDEVLYFPDWEILPYDEFSPHEEIVGTRLKTLSDLLGGRRGVVVVPVRAFVRNIIPPADLRAATVDVAVGDAIKPDALISHLIATGYTREQVVEEVGTFSMRGGILDVYCQGAEYPVRIEFFGDEIDSIREFDPVSQRSTQRVESVSLLPSREVILGDDATGRFMASFSRGDLKKRKMEDVVMHVKERFFFDGIEAYAPHFYSGAVTLETYLPRDAFYVLLDPDTLAEKAGAFFQEAETIYEERSRKEAFPVPQSVFLEWAQIEEFMKTRATVSVSPLRSREDDYSLDVRSPDPFAGSLRILREALVEAAGRGYETFILCDNIGQAERLEEIVPGEDARVTIAVGLLSQGFVFPDANLQVLTDHEIFGRYRRRPRYPRFKGEGPVESYRALNQGDFVVHIDHGIGRYSGVERLTLEGRETECLLINYQGGDRLYVPIEQLDLLQKYIGKDSEPPSLSKLGGASWERVKARTKKAIKQMAEELIKLYALRQARPGFAFSPDSRWQRELEASFIYDDTPDQLRTTHEIKSDMEADKPMDRLICGDVGYGKTEVAVRAAFKAVQDGKQVALLVPTTVLAQQHFHTFRERLAEYPVKVEMLSRFRTRREQKGVVEELGTGQVDIVIGTHRLLQKDIEFSDLGLVIIDEEQRFGVAHKEKFKHLRATVDVLTLTATPIPRTLHMALMGARDMSIIDTPPRGRLPVDTELVKFDEEVVISAILRELDRGGQVFFVHNRVETIDTIAAHLIGLLPNVRFAIAHGQMKERDLEKVMLDFIDREFDVLVSTMIVESGLDIPNVNTIIVNRAESLGLAQLYQLRGRVGRSKHRAYAYFLVPKKRRLTDVQRKRLRALTEFTELGSGLKVAMRDLEIRGCGNILGPEQSGYVAEVGFDLYVKLLEEAVKELRGEPVQARISTRIETDIPAFIPETYVEDEKQRVIFYKKLVEARTLEEVAELESELVDRFGRVPREGRNLLEFQRLRILGADAGVERVSVKSSGIFLEAGRDADLSVSKIENIVRAGIDVELFSGERAGIGVKGVPEAARERLEVSRKVLNALI